MSRSAKSVLVVVFAWSLSYSYAQSSAQVDSDKKAAATAPTSVISDGDMLDIAVFQSPDLSAKVRVGEDGDVLLPLGGKAHLQGLSVADASALLRSQLMARRYVKDPKVTVSITEYANRGVSVLGEVQKPGIYTASGSRRLDDYISLSGGLTKEAGTGVSITHQTAPDKPTIVRISSTGKPTSGSNPLIEFGDTIIVPKAGEVYVVGDVVRPGGYLMDRDEQLTIVQALALAQGANHTALLKHSMIVRRTEKGRVEIPVNIEKVMAMKTKDLTLVDDDILFIPVSKTKTAVNRSLEAIVQTAVGAASFRTF